VGLMRDGFRRRRKDACINHRTATRADVFGSLITIPPPVLVPDERVWEPSLRRLLTHECKLAAQPPPRALSQARGDRLEVRRVLAQPAPCVQAEVFASGGAAIICVGAVLRSHRNC
jgi:hypothetical protein